MRGGSIQNPIHVLVKLLESMRYANGSIAVEGFYDNVDPLLSDEDREDVHNFPFDPEAEKTALGILGYVGEEGYHVLEQRWHRPTLEVVGIAGGFAGRCGGPLPCVRITGLTATTKHQNTTTAARLESFRL